VARICGCFWGSPRDGISVISEPPTVQVYLNSVTPGLARDFGGWGAQGLCRLYSSKAASLSPCNSGEKSSSFNWSTGTTIAIPLFA